jgi:hypothetical protein
MPRDYSVWSVTSISVCIRLLTIPLLWQWSAKLEVDGAVRPHDVMRECGTPEHPSPFWVRIRIIYKLVLSAHELLTLPGSTR